MRRFILFAAATGALLPFSLGCSQKSQVVRGQGPSEGFAPGGPGMPGGPGYGPGMCPSPGMCPAPGMGYGPGMAGGMPGGPGTAVDCYGQPLPASYGPGWAPPGYSPSVAFAYNEPCNSVYPPPQDAPGVVQYPYYTVKGPDCFFHK